MDFARVQLILRTGFNSILIVAERFKTALERVEGMSDDIQTSVEMQVALRDDHAKR